MREKTNNRQNIKASHQGGVKTTSIPSISTTTKLIWQILLLLLARKQIMMPRLIVLIATVHNHVTRTWEKIID